MSGEIKITDYAEEYDDCTEVLDEELPEYKEVDPSTLKPKVDEKKFFGVNTLFDEDDDEEDDTFFDMDKHWVGMPAHEQSHLMPHKQLIVNFQTEEDLLAFARLVGRKLTMKTKSIWYPERDTIASVLTRWIDEEEEGFTDANE